MIIVKDLEITDTAYGGYGVGRSKNGQVIFVNGTVEGDICDIQIIEKKKSFSYGKLIA